MTVRIRITNSTPCMVLFDAGSTGGSNIAPDATATFDVTSSFWANFRIQLPGLVPWLGLKADPGGWFGSPQVSVVASTSGMRWNMRTAPGSVSLTEAGGTKEAAIEVSLTPEAAALALCGPPAPPEFSGTTNWATTVSSATPSAGVPPSRILLEPGKTATVSDKPYEGIPYGGFLLRLGDDDKAQKWGGVTPDSPKDPASNLPHPSDPVNAGQNYVAELVQDLILLGYFAPSRGTRSTPASGPSTFSIDLVGAVLALKADLSTSKAERGYGIPASEHLKDVPRVATPASVGPIYYLPGNKWMNPRAAFVHSDVFEHLIDGSKKELAKETASIAKLEKSLSALSKDRSFSYNDSENVKHSDKYANGVDEYTALKKLIDADPPPKSLHSIEARVKTVGTQLDELRASLGDVAKFVDGLNEDVRRKKLELDRILAWKPSAFDDADWTTWELDDEFHDKAKKLEYYKPLLQKMGKHIDELENAFTKKLEPELQKAFESAASVTASSGGAPIFQEINALATTAKEHLEALLVLLDGYKSQLQNLGGDLTNPDDVKLKPMVERYGQCIRQYSIIDPMTAYCIKLMRHVRMLNGRMAFVLPHGDETVLAPVVNGIPFGAADDEKPKAPDKAKKPDEHRAWKTNMTAVVDAGRALGLARSAKMTRVEVPAPIVKWMLANESGNAHVYSKYATGGIKRVVLCGTDFHNLSAPFLRSKNTKTGQYELHQVSKELQNLSFDEFESDPTAGWIMSRGWGLSQCTNWGNPYNRYDVGAFGIEQDGTIVDHTAKTDTQQTYSFKYLRGLPVPESRDTYYPPHIISASHSQAIAGLITTDKFHTRIGRDCTYSKRFACAECLQRFEENDFEYYDRAYIAKPTVFLKILNEATDERLKDAADEYKHWSKSRDLPDDYFIAMRTPAQDAAGKPVDASADDRAEWPCSWLTARSAYAGAIPASFRYIKQLIGFAKSEG